MSLLTKLSKSEEDVLNRGPIIEFLTSHLENTSSSFVLNIESAWGTGKTFFLKEWEKYLKGKEGIEPIMFNVWESDYYEDSFIPFFSTVTNALSPDKEDKEKIHKFIGDILIKGSGLALKSVLKKYAGEDIANVYDVALKESVEVGCAELESFHSKKKEIKGLKDFLKGQVNNKKVFVLVDELDRCNPLYAIDVLEKIKHFFDIPGLIFIVATDTNELCESIKAVYGSGFNSRVYLQRFFDQTYTLPEPSYLEFCKLLLKKDPLEGEVYSVLESVPEEMSKIFSIGKLTLREIERCYIRLRAVTSSPYLTKTYLTCALKLIIKDVKPELDTSILMNSKFTKGNNNNNEFTLMRYHQIFNYSLDSLQNELRNRRRSELEAKHIEQLQRDLLDENYETGKIISHKHTNAVRLAANLN